MHQGGGTLGQRTRPQRRTRVEFGSPVYLRRGSPDAAIDPGDSFGPAAKP
jgi:hypothetical protein